MGDFDDFQKSFHDAILDPDQGFTKEIISEHAEARLDIYRGNIFEGLRKALSLTFPGTWTLLGDKCADSVAMAFCRQKENLPQTGCLDEWGELFPQFLSKLEQLSTAPYAEDYARYEWQRQLSYRAADATPLTPEQLSLLTEDEANKAVFTFMPSFQTFSSLFPIEAIHNVATNPDAEPFDLTSEPHYALLLRQRNIVERFWVSKSLWDFCRFLHEGKPLQEAAEKVMTEDPAFDLTEAFHFLLHNNFLHDMLKSGGDNNDKNT